MARAAPWRSARMAPPSLHTIGRTGLLAPSQPLVEMDRTPTSVAFGFLADLRRMAAQRYERFTFPAGLGVGNRDAIALPYDVIVPEALVDSRVVIGASVSTPQAFTLNVYTPDTGAIRTLGSIAVPAGGGAATMSGPGGRVFAGEVLFLEVVAPLVAVADPVSAVLPAWSGGVAVSIAMSLA